MTLRDCLVESRSVLLDADDCLRLLVGEVTVGGHNRSVQLAADRCE